MNGSIISTNIDAANIVSSLHQISELKATSCNIHNYQLIDASFIFNASATANTPTKAALEYIVYLKTFEALADLDIQIISATSAQVDVVAYRPNGSIYPMQPWGVVEFVNPNIIHIDNTSTKYQRLRLLPNIGANALIVDSSNPTFNIDNNVISVCLAPAATCVPSAPVEFSATWNQLVSHKRLTFSINGSPGSIFTGLAEVGDDDADISFEDYFYRFGAANRVEGNYFIISTSGGNQGAFRLGFDSESGQAIISARDDSYNPLSTTLELIATNHPDDFATHYFGGSVTLHACGISEPA